MHSSRVPNFRMRHIQIDDRKQFDRSFAIRFACIRIVRDIWDGA